MQVNLTIWMKKFDNLDEKKIIQESWPKIFHKSFDTPFKIWSPIPTTFNVLDYMTTFY